MLRWAGGGAVVGALLGAAWLMSGADGELAPTISLGFLLGYFTPWAGLGALIGAVLSFIPGGKPRKRRDP
jgi:hypothetical protein